jgi:hypothetical protein
MNEGFCSLFATTRVDGHLFLVTRKRAKNEKRKTNDSSDGELL